MTAAVDAIVTYLIEGLKEDGGRVRVEELISAAACVAGERCIDAAGDFDARNHDFPPGSHVFSDSVNVLLAGDGASDVAAVPAESVAGILRDRVVGRGYQLADFPSLEDVFSGFAARIGNATDWGRVPLSVPDEHKPLLLPIRVAYETRTAMDQLLSGERDAKGRLRLATLALAEVLVMVAEAIDRKVALRLALETVNGMAKTAPMTDQAFRQAAADAGITPVN